MARGWESKAVEQQQDDARSTSELKPFRTPEQRELESRKQGLELSRSRILDQIQCTQNPRYREILEKTLAAIDEQLAQLG